jgi:arylsulfatase A-like enzyme
MNKTFLTLASFSSVFAIAQTQKPNIMIIMVDDMGYSDPGCFGGEINTPNIDSLAANGLRFTQFYNSSRSCPSRGSLMTGLYPHQAGITAMGVSLNNKCVTIPEVLKTAGYNTAMTGKWHLSLTQGRANNDEQMQWLANRVDYGNFAPLASYPCNRGFDEHFGIVWGVANFFDPFSLVHNEERIATVPDDFYMTNYITQKSVDLIDSLSKDDKPFFMYVAHTAPHWPLHALPEDIAKYKGKYDGGWDELRRTRYNTMIELGLIDAATMPYAPNDSKRNWQNEGRKAWEAAHMEVHAAMVDRVDQGVGEIIAKLKETGEYENTIIFFMSDNGASYERYATAGFDRPSMLRNGEKIYYPGEFAIPGPENTMNAIGDGWAGAVNTPFRYWKSESFHGGNATPMIVHWPAGLKAKAGTITHQPGHVMDIMPTCLELAGATYPATYKTNNIIPLESSSIKPIMDGEQRPVDQPIYWEHEGGRAIRLGNWKLVSLKGFANWQLYNLANDLSETKNVAAENPEKVKELKELWNAWAKKMGLNVPAEIADTPLKLAFYYPFDGNTTDASTNKYVLTSPNGQAFTDGKYGQSLQLNGTNQYLDLNTAGIVNPATQQYSLCVWINNSSTNVPASGVDYEEVVLAQKDGPNDVAGRIALYTRLNGTNTYFNNFLGANANLSNVGKYKRNEWMHVGLVCNPATREVTYYIDGVKDTTCYAKAAFESCTGGFRIGAHKALKNYWNGKIDELYFFKGLLSEADVNKIMINTYFSTNSVKFLGDTMFNILYDNNQKLLSVNADVVIKNIVVYALNGKEVIRAKKTNQLSLSNIPSGTFVVRVFDQNGYSKSKYITINR